MKYIHIAKAVCLICNFSLPKRVNYLYEESLKGWLCRSCWHKKYDSKTNTLQASNG